MSTLIKKSPIFPSFPGFFDDFFTKDVFDWNDKNFAKMGSSFPSINLKENEKDYVISLAAPGMDKNDFKVEYNNGILTMKAEKKEEKEDKDKEGKFIRREFSYEAFSRAITMPDDAREDDVEATYNDGILNIVILKKEPKKVGAPKTIKVK